MAAKLDSRRRSALSTSLWYDLVVRVKSYVYIYGYIPRLLHVLNEFKSDTVLNQDLHHQEKGTQCILNVEKESIHQAMNKVSLSFV